MYAGSVALVRISIQPPDTATAPPTVSPPDTDTAFLNVAAPDTVTTPSTFKLLPTNKLSATQTLLDKRLALLTEVPSQTTC